MPVMLAGNSPRLANQGELLNRQNLGRSYYAVSDFLEGDLLDMHNLEYRSPHTGIDKTNIEEYISRPLKRSIKKGTVLNRSIFEEDFPISDKVINAAKKMQLSLPVRLHDYKNMESMFPIGAFEFHLSFDEVLSDIDITNINPDNKYSIHLPDYINPTQLIDPFSNDDSHKKDSLKILDRTVKFAKELQELTGEKVPIVGSFSIVHSERERFFEDYSALLKKYLQYGVEITPQWLPPIAWYFGGSISLNVMNKYEDIEYLRRHEMGVCMDICHLILGRNYYNFSASDIIDNLKYFFEK